MTKQFNDLAHQKGHPFYLANKDRSNNGECAPYPPHGTHMDNEELKEISPTKLTTFKFNSTLIVKFLRHNPAVSECAMCVNLGALLEHGTIRVLKGLH